MVRADPAALASGIAERLESAGETGLVDSWLEADAGARAAIDAALAEIGAPSEPGLAAVLGASYADGDLVYTASSMPIRDQEAFLPSSDADVLFLANRGANGIDGLISSGIGAARASGRPTVIVTGDLGLLHDLGGLAALQDVSIPVRIVVVNNDGGGIFHFLPQEQAMKEGEFEALLGTPRGVDVGSTAALFGLEHRPIDNLEDLAAALAAGTALIEVKVNRGENVAVHRRLAAAVAEALA
jgi:2-succinyl-5-enolpyruvyl-6-hydroxy-3-cyclohexene-1-carboxylate synthase